MEIAIYSDYSQSEVTMKYKRSKLDSTLGNDDTAQYHTRI